MKRMICFLILIFIFVSTAGAEDWLEGGYVGSPNYGESRQYFTDPIFYTKVPVSQPLSFYNPYYANVFYREPLYLGTYADRSGQLRFQMPVNMNFDPYSAMHSDFRNRSLAGMKWEPFIKNWTNTTIYATKKSSFRVFEGGAWRIL